MQQSVVVRKEGWTGSLGNDLLWSFLLGGLGPPLSVQPPEVAVAQLSFEADTNYISRHKLLSLTSLLNLTVTTSNCLWRLQVLGFSI